MHHQDPGDGEELALAAGQRGGLPAEQRLDAGRRGDRVDPAADLGSLDPEVLGSERQLRFDRRPDDLLGRILQDGPDDLGEVAELGGRSSAGRRSGRRR